MPRFSTRPTTESLLGTSIRATQRRAACVTSSAWDACRCSRQAMSASLCTSTSAHSHISRALRRRGTSMMRSAKMTTARLKTIRRTRPQVVMLVTMIMKVQCSSKPVSYFLRYLHFLIENFCRRIRASAIKAVGYVLDIDS